MGKVALITGATAGFGEATAIRFANEGWDLVLTGRRLDRLKNLQQQLKTTSNRVEILHFDVRNETEVITAIGSLSEDIVRDLTVVVNNAGLAVGRGPLDEAVTDDWERMIDTNIKGLLYVSKAIIPLLKANGSGHIVNVASIAGKEVYAGGNVYCATKHAVDALSRSMRLDLVNFGIKVSNIAPGAAETEFSIVRFKGDEETANSVYKGFQPLSANDVADAIFYVCNCPPNVTISDLVIMPTAQASATVFNKNL
ncbi:MAG: NAD(P)-dependent oxidoreductase [Candidatus Fluviicola riflensis]|nr:MAG: NAD(P)-dependent oxidoreductase [Candidatus Fluviicola riflensis]OGS77196.1 MAG: NAD(P)-dependent oxidoreductase [Candidatus Fluviicola riflensis]OGS82131.1 MAG: NAD(P)-dependent oxidoreductase [Fluviicola sp. RIFCSPHIGHO2_01_FULL_43_53]OGS87825.1 MAG: NAD(P)-dependent oxidoreductase [Fluviicola sp. RIFCSPHIGHO2_12_FULL_43_24]